MDLTKDFEFRGAKYQISKLPCADSMWLIMQIIQKAMPSMIEDQMKFPLAEAPIVKERPEMTRDDMAEIMKTCFKAVKQYKVTGDQEVPMPILLKNGAYNPFFASLEYDIIATAALVANVLMFNVQSFFEEGALQELVQSLSGLSLANILPSTDTSGLQ
jgi:hypothetical protein